MNKEEFIQFVAKNLKYHLPSDFNSYQIEVNHMRLTISESNSSYVFILICSSYLYFIKFSHVYKKQNNYCMFY